MESASAPTKPIRYYLDTTGSWMLDALFDEDLGLLETRQSEYLAFLINAYCVPGVELVGVVPTKGREQNPLPSVYQELRHAGEISSVVPIGSEGLYETEELLVEQLDTFTKHLALYPSQLQDFAAFHAHPRVNPGFFDATEWQEITPGVPSFVEEFLASDGRLKFVLECAPSWDESLLKQAFSIFQRGYKYAAAAAAVDAFYLTHPVRWSSAGFGRREATSGEFDSIIGGVAASLIRASQVTDAAELHRRMEELRSYAPKWRADIDQCLVRLKDASSETQKRAVRKSVDENVRELAALWVQGTIGASGKKALIGVTAGLWASLIKVLAPDFSSVASTTLVGSILYLWITPLKVGRIGARVLRPWVNYGLEPYIPQSCAGCGAPLRVSKGAVQCLLCGAVLPAA